MRDLFRYSIVFIVTSILAYALLSTGVWVLTIIAGLVAAIMFSKGYLKATASSFLGGVASSGLFIFLNYVTLGAPIVKIGYYAGEVAGLPGSIFLIFSILLTGLYCIIGSIIGTYTGKLIHGS